MGYTEETPVQKNTKQIFSCTAYAWKDGPVIATSLIKAKDKKTAKTYALGLWMQAHPSEEGYLKHNILISNGGVDIEI